MTLLPAAGASNERLLEPQPRKRLPSSYTILPTITLFPEPTCCSVQQILVFFNSGSIPGAGLARRVEAVFPTLLKHHARSVEWRRRQTRSRNGPTRLHAIAHMSGLLAPCYQPANAVRKWTRVLFQITRHSAQHSASETAFAPFATLLPRGSRIAA